VEVREVHPTEYDAAGQVTLAAYRHLPGAHMTDSYAAELVAVDRRAVEAVVLVAVDPDGSIAGAVTYVPDPSSPWAEDLREGEVGIRMMAVSPDAQRGGVGAALLSACLERARVERRDAVFLHSTPWMATAHRLYERAGFRRVPERDWVPEPDVPLLAFRLPLTPETDR
jgi:GNAT superfamily N-acetyltransferase